MTSRQSHSRPSVLRNIWQKFHRLTLWIDNNNTRFIQSLIYLIRTVIIVYKVRHNAHKRGENLHFRFKSIGINIWLTKAGFEITKSILSCGHARFRAGPKILSCTNRARKKSRDKWKIVFILKYLFEAWILVELSIFYMTFKNIIMRLENLIWSSEFVKKDGEKLI